MQPSPSRFEPAGAAGFRRFTTDELVGARPTREAREAARLPVIVVLDNVRSAYNVGLIFRLCDCVNIRELWLTGITPYPGVSEHATRHLQKTGVGGSLEVLPWRYLAHPVPEVARLKAEGWTVMAFEQGEATTPWLDLPAYPLPLVLLLGHEREGVADALLALADTVLEMPVRGITNSLNVALCAAVALYDLLKRGGHGLPAALPIPSAALPSSIPSAALPSSMPTSPLPSSATPSPLPPPDAP